jgi:hypothetical protein
VDEDAIIEAEWAGDLHDGIPAHFIFDDREHGELVVSVRGTWGKQNTLISGH